MNKINTDESFLEDDPLSKHHPPEQDKLRLLLENSNVIQLQSEEHILQIASQQGIGRGSKNTLYRPNTKKTKKKNRLIVSASNLELPPSNLSRFEATPSDTSLDAGRLTWITKLKKRKKVRTHDPFKRHLNWASTDNPDGVPIVNDVVDQQSCGSCWAIAATGTLEASVARRAAYESYNAYHDVSQARQTEVDSLPLLSIQQLVDCDSNNQGCVGGNPLLAFSYLYRHGLTTSTKYPYQGYQQDKCEKKQKSIVSTTSWGIVESNHEKHMELVVRYIGPLAVGFNGADRDFLNYQGGIFSSKHCKQYSNHALLITGYGADENHTKYWIARNSWGTSWGENGYVRIARSSGHKGVPGTCGIARSPSVALGGRLLYTIAKVDPAFNSTARTSSVLEGTRYNPKMFFRFLKIHKVYAVTVLGFLLATVVSWWLSAEYRRRRRRRLRRLSETIPIVTDSTQQASYGATTTHQQPHPQETIGVI